MDVVGAKQVKSTGRCIIRPMSVSTGGESGRLVLVQSVVCSRGTGVRLLVGCVGVLVGRQLVADVQAIRGQSGGGTTDAGATKSTVVQQDIVE